MGKSTLVLVLLAALGLGSLIGVSLVTDVEPEVTGPVAVASTGGAPVYRFLSPGDVTIEQDDFDRTKPSTVGENFSRHDGELKTETVTVDLDVNGEVEYKAMMQQGNSITYTWSTDGGQVYFDFHGHDPSFGPEFWTRYAEGEGAMSSGSIVAPYSGQHGWYWVNLEGAAVTITLTVAGFYDEIVELDLGGY